MLTEKHYKEIKEELDNCQNPLFFFDDDPDGLASFIILYRYKKEGHGFVVKTHPKLDIRSAPKIESYHADKVFVLDVAKLEQDFIDASKVPVIWIDHHGPFERTNVKYFNPRLINQESNYPTTYLCYMTVKQDLWLAALGCIADYHIPDFIEEFRKEYPDLIGDNTTIQDMYHNSELTKLIKVFSFALKGKTSEVLKNIKILTRINSPYEILREETPQGKFLFKNYKKIQKAYDELLKSAISSVGKEKLLVFIYEDNKTSFTGELSNELMYLYPDRIIIVGRKKDGDVRMSIRSTKTVIPPILEKVLIGLEGYGGGHELACGASVKQDDFDEFVNRIKKEI